MSDGTSTEETASDPEVTTAPAQSPDLHSSADAPPAADTPAGETPPDAAAPPTNEAPPADPDPDPEPSATDAESVDNPDIVAALLHERSGYAHRKLDDRIAQVDAQLKIHGYKAPRASSASSTTAPVTKPAAANTADKKPRSTRSRGSRKNK